MRDGPFLDQFGSLYVTVTPNFFFCFASDAKQKSQQRIQTVQDSQVPHEGSYNPCVGLDQTHEQLCDSSLDPSMDHDRSEPLSQRHDYSKSLLSPFNDTRM